MNSDSTSSRTDEVDIDADVLHQVTHHRHQALHAAAVPLDNVVVRQLRMGRLNLLQRHHDVCHQICGLFHQLLDLVIVQRDVVLLLVVVLVAIVGGSFVVRVIVGRCSTERLGHHLNGGRQQCLAPPIEGVAGIDAVTALQEKSERLHVAASSGQKQVTRPDFGTVREENACHSDELLAFESQRQRSLPTPRVGGATAVVAVVVAARAGKVQKRC